MSWEKVRLSMVLAEGGREFQLGGEDSPGDVGVVHHWEGVLGEGGVKAG